MKHNTQCYRTINGEKWMNYADLIRGEEENERLIKEAKEIYGQVKKVKHHTGDFYQLFVKPLQK